MCNNLALWCSTHCSETELQSGLCRGHFDSHEAACICCCKSTEDGAVLLEWHDCPEEGCRYELRICKECALPNVPQAPLVCISCWRLGAKLCRFCGETPAQNDYARYRRCCGACFSVHYIAETNEAIREESRAYLASVAEQQTWTGEEPALQVPFSCR